MAELRRPWFMSFTPCDPDDPLIAPYLDPLPSRRQATPVPAPVAPALAADESVVPETFLAYLRRLRAERDAR